MKNISKIFIIIGLILSIPLSASADTFTKYNQDVTAYSASKYDKFKKLRYTHSSELPKNGYVAMRSDTVVAFGSTVVTPYSITNGNGYSTATYLVQDTGVEHHLTTHAIDIWWGYCRTDAYEGVDASALGCKQSDSIFQSALAFGRKTMNLQYFTK